MWVESILYGVFLGYKVCLIKPLLLYELKSSGVARFYAAIDCGKLEALVFEFRNSGWSYWTLYRFPTDSIYGALIGSPKSRFCFRNSRLQIFKILYALEIRTSRICVLSSTKSNFRFGGNIQSLECSRIRASLRGITHCLKRPRAICCHSFWRICQFCHRIDYSRRGF